MTTKDGIIGLAIGDALGVPFEFNSRDEMRKKPCSDMIGHKRHNQPVGTWSDDTSMAIATLDSIIECDGIDYFSIANNFVLWSKGVRYNAHNCEPFDMGGTTYGAISKFKSNLLYGIDDPTKAGFDDYFSNGNGSVMRILPIAYYINANKEGYTDLDIANLTGDISSLTHGHEISRMGCYLYTKYALSILDGKSFEEAYEDLTKADVSMFSARCKAIYKRILSGELGKETNRDNIKSSGYVVDSVEAAIWCCLTTKSYEEATVKAVNLGGDTDTIASLAGGLAGIKYGLNNILTKWVDKLVKKDYLFDLCDKFDKKLNSNKTYSI